MDALNNRQHIRNLEQECGDGVSWAGLAKPWMDVVRTLATYVTIIIVVY